MGIKPVIRLIRPTQWTKNVFVFAGLLFDQAWNDVEIVTRVLLAFAAFCLTASAIYVINDLADREEDRKHPVKRLRPLASGEVSTPVAVSLIVGLLAGGFVLGWLASGLVLLMLCAYVAINLGYSAGLKRVVILDVFIIAAGFLLRILAGTIGVGMEPSEWLFLCSLCLTLFLGFGKRRAELASKQAAAQPANASRHVLSDYSPVMLDSMMAVVAACAFVTYGLFAMSDSTVERHGTSALVYTLPFVMYAMFRYFFMLHHRGQGGDPSEDLIRDPHILVSGFGWLVTTYFIIS